MRSFAKVNRRIIRILNNKNVLQPYYLFVRLSNVPFYHRTQLYRAVSNCHPFKLLTRLSSSNINALLFYQQIKNDVHHHVAR